MRKMTLRRKYQIFATLLLLLTVGCKEEEPVVEYAEPVEPELDANIILTPAFEESTLALEEEDI